MTDPIAQRLKAEAKIRKLLAVAAGNANENESKQAMAYARRLAEKHGINLHEIKPDVKVELTPAQKAAKVRAMSSMFGNIKRAYPGVDDEDYSQYAKGRRDDPQSR